MSQEEIMRVLEQAKEPLSAREIIVVLISNNVLIGEKRVFALLNNLIRHKEIRAKEIGRREARERYKKINITNIRVIKRRIRLYYV